MSPDGAALRERLSRLPAPAGGAPVTAEVLDSPVGPLVAAAVDEGVAFLEFGTPERLDRQLAILEKHFGAVRAGSHRHLDALANELSEYFAGSRRRFEVPLVIRGTAFQESVWHRLLDIPYGETVAYSDIAAALSVRNGQRAVGLANGQNRIAIVIPCHRVIERGGGLRGYGGGLDRKRFLLGLERANTDPLAGTPLHQARG